MVERLPDMSRLERFYPKILAKSKLDRILSSIESNKDSSINIVDMPTEGEVGGQQGIQEGFTREFPAGEIEDSPDGTMETLYRRPRQASTKWYKGVGDSELALLKENGIPGYVGDRSVAMAYTDPSCYVETENTYLVEITTDELPPLSQYTKLQEHEFGDYMPDFMKGKAVDLSTDTEKVAWIGYPVDWKVVETFNCKTAEIGEELTQLTTGPEFDQFKRPRQAQLQFKEGDIIELINDPGRGSGIIINNNPKQQRRGYLWQTAFYPWTEENIKNYRETYDEPDGMPLPRVTWSPENQIRLSTQPLHPELIRHYSKYTSKIAEIGQELTQLTTEREKSKVKQQETQHGLWNESYSDENSFEDPDLKLGENSDDDSVDPLEQQTYEPYAQGTGPLNPRYEDSGKRYDIVLHSSRVAKEEINPNKGPSQIWIAVDLDGTILEPPPGDIYEKDGKNMFGEPKPGAREAMYEMIDGGARVSVYTARTYFAKTKEQEDSLLFDIENVLVENDIPFTDVYVGNKPPAMVYVDDRAIRFDNNWDEVLKSINKKEAQIQFTADQLIRLYELEYKIDQLNKRKKQLGGWIEDSIQNKILQWEEELNNILKIAINTMYAVYKDWMEIHTGFIDDEMVHNYTANEVNTIMKKEYPQYEEDSEEYDEIFAMLFDNIIKQTYETIQTGGIPPSIIKVYNELESGITGDTGQDIILFQKALTTAHQSGNMSEYLAEMTNITTDLLNDLTAGKYIPEWDAELSKIANDLVKDTVNFQGIDIDIEWPSGSIRSYEGDDTYVTHMKADYGYARGVEGNDGEELDIYLADRESTSPVAFIIEQLDGEGNYDEDKIVLGVESEGEAADIYLEHMPSYALGDIREVPIERLRNALYGKPEDRRGQEDQVPSEEKEATKTWPEDDIFENEFTDGTEDRENRDIPRPEEKEKATYRNALKVSL